MAEADEAREPGLVDRRRFGPVGNERDHRRVVAGADTPDVEIGDAILAVAFEAAGDLTRHPCFRLYIEQYRTGAAHEAP
jgi:hypothetical protein